MKTIIMETSSNKFFIKWMRLCLSSMGDAAKGSIGFGMTNLVHGKENEGGESWPAMLKVLVVVRKGERQMSSDVQQCNGYGIYNGKVSQPGKRIGRVFTFFCNHLRPNANLTTCPSSPGTREPISVAIPFDQLGKKGALMQKVNVSPGKTKMDKNMRWSYPAFVVQGRCIASESFVMWY
jgi:hypothetical protein